MYKVLSVNSLVLSYTLSVLYLNGVKSGDYQATFSGLKGII
jgi:manganese-transporting P-type ATPase